MPDSSDLGILGVCIEMDEDTEGFTYMIAIEYPNSLNFEDLRIISIPKST